MKSTVTVQVDTDTMLRLISHLKVRGGAQDISEALNSAITLWLREQAQLPAGCDPASVRGYQWKSLFLPEGTEIRSWSYGEHNYARVEGDEIIHNGKSVTPNEFAQSFARSMRNAWLDLHIRRPEDKQFKIAHRLRLELEQQAKQPKPPTLPTLPTLPTPLKQPQAEAPTQPGTSIGALLAALQAQLPASQPLAPRDPTPGQGWTLPERRKYRFRLEDVAFD